MLTNPNNTVIYTGVTNDLFKRVTEHKEKRNKGFTLRYNITKLVYFEEFNQINEAIEREKQIKAGSRSKKIELINSLNPQWEDLYENFI